MNSTSITDSKILPEAVLNLRDRLKHGQNVAKILESQIDTAQQNISLLQGQVRLATETILNLKKHFQETENILSQLVSPDQAPIGNTDNENKDPECESSQKHVNANVDSTTRSPRPSEETTETGKSFEEKLEQNKSPYAQQLRQVLDVLTDEEPRRNNDSQHHYHNMESSNPSKDCTSQDCRVQRKQFSSKCDCGNSSCGQEHFSSQRDDYCRSKHKTNGHTISHHIMTSQKYAKKVESPHHSPSSYSHHCNGPCCSNVDSHEYSRHYNEGTTVKHHQERHHHPHCNGEKCQCHNYVNYVPYGGRYHVLDSIPSQGPEVRHRVSPPMSNRKRQYVPIMPGEEPPHLKYTKVKRVDGNKLTAQKVLQDFTKRRYFSYNPRYDLDLLIVPPPIPAMDLIKSSFIRHQSSPKDGKSQEQIIVRKSPTNCVETKCESSPERTQETDRNPQLSSPGNPLVNHNNNNVYTKHPMYKSPPGKVNILPPIKEEVVDPQSILEDHISKPRRDTSISSPVTVPSPQVNSNHCAEQQETWTKEMQQIPLSTNSAAY